MGPEKPGKSWNFILAFSRTGKSWEKATGPGKSWKFVKPIIQVKKYSLSVWKAVTEINII